MDFATELWKLVQTAGPFASALMFYLWWDERSDKKKLQEKYDATIERSLTAIVETKAVLERFTNVLLKGSGQ
jgi:hypothetical protein